MCFISPRAGRSLLERPKATAGCGSTESDSGGSIEFVGEPRTIDLGPSAPLAVDGDALVHVAYRRDQTLVVRGDLRSGAARTLLARRRRERS
jgi:hypothetical protein